jgi:hypothetical protein
MEIAHIAPVKFLEKYSSNYAMILAPLVTKYEEYRDYFRDFKGTKILDNGMYELSVPLSNKELLEVAKDINPDVLILPDVQDNFVETIDEIEVARRVFKELKCKKMGVIQGKSLPELDTAFWTLQKMTGVDVIGIPKRICVDRAGFLNRLSLRSEGISKPIHLLGCNAMNASEEIKVASKFEWVQGIDSTIAIKLGLGGIILHPIKGPVKDIKRPSRYFDIKEDLFVGVIDYNMSVMSAWAIGCNGPSWSFYWNKVEKLLKGAK